MVNLPLQNIRIIQRLDIRPARLPRRAVLAQPLNRLLALIPGFIDLLRRLARPLGQLLLLIFNLAMQPLENGQHGGLQRARRLLLTRREALGVGPDILKQLRDAAILLVEVVALLQRAVDRLEHLLVLLAVVVRQLLRRRDVVFEVGAGVLPGLQALGEELRHLARVFVRDGALVGGGAGGQAALRGGGGCDGRHGGWL